MKEKYRKKKPAGGTVLMLASVASMIDQFNMPNIRLLQEMGYKVHVACNFEKGNTCDTSAIAELQDTLQKMQAVWHQWDCPRDIWCMRQCLKAYRQLEHLLERNSYAWMHCHSPIGGALARIAAHRAGVPVIYTAHGFHFYRGAPLKNWVLYYPAEKLLAYWTDVLITVNKEDYCFAKRHLRAGKVCYIPGVGVDFRRCQSQEVPARAEFCRKYAVPENATLLLSVGELSIRKNHQIVLDALSKIQRTDIYYLIFGLGRSRGRLEKKAETLGIAEYVRMPGYQENVSELYHNTDIFVFPSLQEGMPVALMEAMAAGMPCVVSDIRGNRELIDHEKALFQPRHAGQLCEKLKIMIENKQFRSAQGMYNRSKIGPYSLDTVQKRMQLIYQRECNCLEHV